MNVNDLASLRPCFGLFNGHATHKGMIYILQIRIRNHMFNMIELVLLSEYMKGVIIP